RSLGASGSQFGALISGAAVLTDYATHADWRAGTGQDVQSAAGNPNFRVPTGTPASIDLRVQGTTPAEGAGLAGTNITTDAEGDSRTSTTPVDIGADAGNYTANDIFGPQITFTPLAVTNSTDPRTLTVTITDRTGVATSGNRLPNLYWRINTAGTWNTSQGVSVGSNQYTFTYGNGVAAGDSVFYYIVAQDTVATPNLAITPALGATGLTAAPPAATTPPTTLFFYRIQGSLCGTFTIGTGGNYATMGDAVAALNNNIITCDVIMEFITNTNETAGMAINGLQYGTGGPYRVTFRPAAGTSDTVRVTTTGPMVLLTNNVERIIFDGRRGGTGASKSLVFENNGNSAQAACIWMQTDTRRDTIRHMVLRASSLATNTGAITFGGGSIVNGVDDVLVSDNEIRETSQNLRPQVGIFCGGNTLSPAVWNSNIVITNNAIFNHGTTTGSNSGITVGTGVENVTVTNNNIYQQVARGFTTTNLGISVVPTTGGGTFTVSGNFIGGSAPNCGGAAWMANDSTSSSFTTFVGINIAGNASTTMNVENNKIANFKYMTATGSSPYWSGIQVSTSSLGNTVITNNQIGGAGADSVRGFNATTSGAMFGMNLVTVPSVSQNTFTVSNNTISNIRSDNTVNATTTSILNLFANVIGINVGGGANHLSATITNNTIGGSSANEGLYAINPTLATSQQFAYGVRTSYTGTLNLTNNTIRHIYNNAAGATQSTSNHVAAGILATSGINVMTGNSITNVYNSSPQNQTGISASAAGIICTSTIGNNTISGNTIYNVGNTSTVGVPQVAGIIHSGQTGGALTTISRNNINSLTLATNNTNASLLGINIVNGFANVVNNMVRLGIDGQGTNLTTGYFIAGILEQSTNPVNIYHNSVYVGGANVTNGSDGSSSNLTFAIRRLIPPTQPAGIGTLLDRVYNNIFVNARSNVSGGVGKHYAVGLDLGLQYVSDHNIMQASGTGGVLYGLGVPFITTDFTTFDAVRSTLGIDMNSAAANPNFVNPTGDFLNVNLRVQSPTPAEASGTSLASVVTDDFDGQTRSNFTPIDIGASAGNYTVSDVIPPMITYTPLSNSSVESSRSVTGIAITDASGVNTSAGTRPRIYFKKGSDANVFVGNTSADNGWKFVEATNTTSPFQFSLDYSLLTGGTVAVGDVIQYYVIAQDMVTTPNVAINSGLPASAVTSVAMSGTQFPMGGTINTYQITGSFSGTVQVGSGQTYSCLTCEGGLFQAINTIGVLSGNLTVQVTSNLTEDGTHALNQWAESGSGNYSLRIVPSSASNRTIEGVYPAPNLSTPSAGLIRFNAVDRVTIDGRFNGAGSFLTFRNNNITSLAAISVIHFISAGVGQSCENDTVRNCNIQCATNFTTSPTGTPTYIGVYVGGTATTVTQFPSTTNTGFDHNNIVISNNDFSTLTHAVVARGFSPNNLINRLNISNNTFGSATNSQTVSVRGVDLTGCNNFTVHRNTFTNISSQLSTYMAGIDLAQWTSNGTVSNNIICGVSNTLAGVQGAYGINISTTTGVSNINIFNNAISGIITYGANSDITTNLPVGIRLLGGVNIRMYHNTIRMSGTFTNPNASNAAGVLIGSANVQSSELRNNIISLAMNGGSGTKCHALSLPFTGLIQFGIMNNNDYTTTGSQNNLVLFNNTDFTSISAWQAGNGGLDANSVSVPVSFTGTGCSQYYVPSVNPSLFGSNAVSSVVSTDIDGLARSRYYMGADEVTPTLAIGSQPQSQNLCATQTLTFSAVNPSTTFDDNVSRTVNYTYQWQRNNTDIAGATNSLYTKANITTADAGNYRVIIKISTADSIVSNVAVITVAQPITITQQPTAPAPFCLGTGGFSLSMSATGSNLTYQWQHDRSRTGNWVNIPGATTTSYLVSNPVANDSGLYRCLVTGAAVCTPPTVATNSVDVVIRVPVAITSAPTNQIACIGNAFTMTLGVSGTVTSIQWQQDRLRNNTWVNVGTNSATYSVASASLPDSGNYRVIVTGPCNSITLTPSISVVVNSAVQITQQPVSPAPLCVGATINLTAATTGTVSSYQWQYSPAGQGSWTNISGATQVNYLKSNITTADAGDYRLVVNGPCIPQPINSLVVNVVVNSPTSITTQPVWNPTNACTGLGASISVVATGTITSYRWQKFDGSAFQDIAGATTPSYSIASLVLADAGTYRVVITGPCSAPLNSNQAVLNIQQNVAITTNPQNQSGCTGSSASFSVGTVGTVVGYQWQKNISGNWTNISGATNQTYSIATLVIADSGSYRVLVTGNCSAVPVQSSSAMLTVQSPFSITSQPTWQSSPTNVGQTVTLTVGFSGTANFQWQRDQQRNNGWVNVGTNSNTYSFTVNTVADSGNFRCIITGPCGPSSTSTNMVQVFTCQPPSIIQQPQQPQPVCPGGTLSLNVNVNSQGQTINYQWQFDQARNGTWTNISGATNATYTKTNVVAGDDGNYRVQVTSNCTVTPVNSDAVSFAVRAPITITAQPSSQTVCQGANVSLSVTVTGTNPSYQWMYFGAPISTTQYPSAATATLQLTNVTSANTGQYSCFISSPCSPNGISTNTVTLTVNNPPAITQQPVATTGCAGTPISLSVQSSGLNLTYQWNRNSSPVSGATSATYTIANPTSANSGTYNVIVSNNCGTVTSGNAVLTINTPATISTQPVAQTVCTGATVTLTTAINADATNPTYQWQRNGSDVNPTLYPTATSPSLVIANAPVAMSGTYVCIIRTTCQPNGIGTTPVTVTINPATAITTQPQAVTACEQTPASLSVVADGASLTYQWRRGGVNVFGATNATYAIPSLQPSDAGSYDVIVGGACAPLSVTSAAVQLTVNTRPAIT
ncbi:MAG: immunoglobulin domain-containing protein, partial [Candidatus Kapabacteria bacterium]|nr:immunoglobulin domain-containing protein [Candidatus Kapabacteria bacterium]